VTLSLVLIVIDIESLFRLTPSPSLLTSLFPLSHFLFFSFPYPPSSLFCRESEHGLSRFTILDARRQIAATLNMAAGKGTEDVTLYPNTELLFCNIDNIHVMRVSAQVSWIARTVHTDPPVSSVSVPLLILIEESFFTVTTHKTTHRLSQIYCCLEGSWTCRPETTALWGTTASSRSLGG
jgi:Myotubularin-like phosphatase domain